MQTEVLLKHEFWNWTHYETQYRLTTSEEKISAGLAARLHQYALKTLDSAGFKGAIKDWSPSVYTLDGNEAPSERNYCVRWTNKDDGYIEVIGIHTRHGWPFLDHGLGIGR